MREETEKNQEHLRFLKNLDEINKAIQGTSDIDQMMCNVLDTVLSIFACDRAFLLYPCNPDAASWRIPMERSKPDYPGAGAANHELPMTAEVAKTLRALLDNDGPVQFTTNSNYELPLDVAEQFTIKSYLGMAIYPKAGEPWQFGLHQCSHARMWSTSDKELFRVVGQRIADSLSVLLSYKELAENRIFLDNIFENIPNMIFVKNADDLRFVRLNKAGEELLGYTQQELLGKNDYDFFTKEEADFFTAKDREVLKRKVLVDIPEETIHTKDGEKVLHTQKIPLYDSAGEPTHLLGLSEDITERKQMEQALIKSEQMFRTLAENSPDNIARYDASSRTVYVNPTLEKTLGRLESELLGTTPVDNAMLYTTPVNNTIIDEFREYQDKINEVLQTGKETEMDMVMPDTGDGVRYHNIRFVAESGENGAITGVLAIGRDITERRQMEEALLIREREFRNLVDNIPDFIVRYDRNLHRIFVNPAWEKASGLSANEVVHGPIEKIPRVPAPTVSRYVDKLRSVLEDGKPQSIEFNWTNTDGVELYLEYRIVPEYDRSGNITGVLAVGHDLTERKHVEEKLHNLSYAIEQSPVSIVITDIGGRIEFVNGAFTKITGYTFAEALGQHTRILKSGETPAEEYHQLWKTISSGEVWRGEFRNRKKNGELFWEYATIAPVKNADNIISHYVAVKEDITERKKLEDQLRQSQKLEAVGQLAGGVAHDFNNMLGVIIGHTELAMGNAALDDSLHGHLKAIQEASFRSAEITRQLLAFARKQTIRPQILDLNNTLEGMFKLLRRLIGEDIHLVWIPETHLWKIKMDPSQIDQILVNLCVNARDAINGVGQVTIETHNISFNKEYCVKHEWFLPGEYVMLAVSDNGCGMDKQTKDKIFEPFFTTKGAGKGTGLGLATVYGIVKQNSGFIHVYSEPGQGTTFKIYLSRQVDMLKQETEASPALQYSGGNETILVVEDETLHLEMVKNVLEEFGYRVLAASSPREALLTMKAHREIHLLLSDVVLPDMNGPDLAKEVILLFPKVICLFMSGYTENVIAQQGVLKEGFNFIQKPFSTQELAAKVREMLNKR